MHTLIQFTLNATVIGLTATLIMDIWGWLRPRIFGARPNYAMVGRWLLHMRHGQFRHGAIAASPAIQGEALTGWAMHYLTGVVFAMLLLGFTGSTWVAQPTLVPALITGLATVAAPFLLMQPGMGMGFAATKTANPNRARAQSLATHTVFGLGLYLGGLLLRQL